MTHFGIVEFNNLNYQKERLVRFASATEDPTNMIERALSLAGKAHQDQMRDEGVNYLIHPVRAANVLSYEKDIQEPELISAVLLHDVVEDSPVSLNYIQSHFTEKVAFWVDNLTRQREANETEEEKKHNKIEKFIKLMEADLETRLAKCADLLDNIRCWPLIPTDSPTVKKFPRWANETEQFAIPLAEKTDDYLAEKMKQAYSHAQKICSNNILQV